MKSKRVINAKSPYIGTKSLTTTPKTC